jgi:mannan endo-1,4-beta-mannosidase
MRAALASRRRPATTLRSLTAASVLAGLAVISGCAFSNPITAIKEASQPAPAHVSAQSAAAASAAGCGKTTAGRYVGISVAHTALIAPTEKATGITANVVSLYYSIGQAVDMNTIESLCARHMLPILEFDSDTIPVSQITAGAADPYLKNLAQQIAIMHEPVGVDFDHEFNGKWYRWGYRYVTPAQFVAAWRHIVTIFRQNGAGNAIWLWNPNVTMEPPSTTGDLQPWYPGNAYVNWVGLDGYYFGAGQTYASIFNHTIGQVRALTNDPIIIMETGASPVSGRVRAITNLFNDAAKTPGLLGLIYFDYDKGAGHDWYINNDPAALAAFKAGATAYLKAAR